MDDHLENANLHFPHDLPDLALDQHFHEMPMEGSAGDMDPVSLDPSLVALNTAHSNTPVDSLTPLKRFLISRVATSQATEAPRRDSADPQRPYACGWEGCNKDFRLQCDLT